jgi:hypothetical protein
MTEGQRQYLSTHTTGRQNQQEYSEDDKILPHTASGYKYPQAKVLLLRRQNQDKPMILCAETFVLSVAVADEN